MNNFFSTCKTTSEAKKLYRDLIKENHPDAGGSTETAKVINAEFDTFCDRFMADAFTTYKTETGREAYGNDTFSSILAAALKINCRIEIIGFWIYAFESYEIKDQLKEMGFWFSKKHRAWIFSGTAKRNIRTKYTTNDIRNMHGSEVIREETDATAISA